MQLVVTDPRGQSPIAKYVTQTKKPEPKLASLAWLCHVNDSVIVL